MPLKITDHKHVTVLSLNEKKNVQQAGLVLGVTSRTAPVFQTALVVDTAMPPTETPQNALAAVQGGWVQLVTTPALTALPKMASASVILVTQAAVARVSVLDMANVLTTNVIVVRNQVTRIWENTASCQDVQDSVLVQITASVTQRLKSVYAPKDGLVMIVAHLTVQENPSVLAMEAAAILIQEGMAVTLQGYEYDVVIERLSFSQNVFLPLSDNALVSFSYSVIRNQVV